LNTGFYPYVKTRKKWRGHELCVPLHCGSRWKKTDRDVVCKQCRQRLRPAAESGNAHIDGNTPLNAIAFGSDIIVSELKTQSVVSISENGERRTLVSGISVPAGWWPSKGSLGGGLVKGQILKVISNGEVLERPSVLVQGLAQPEGMPLHQMGPFSPSRAGPGACSRSIRPMARPPSLQTI